ncbi:hypothetical protein AB0E96_30310 [Kitasatospora sp. NPDC036755]|uniref:hypothetical protein n=1 Tax=Kitasatospora sp. NPDC036755 TaxID=3154600 RepID=UPI0033C15520
MLIHRHPPLRRRLLLPAVAAVLLTAAGCSPAPEPTAAVQRDGTGYAVVVPLCPDGTVLFVSVRDRARDVNTGWSVSSEGAEATMERYPLFTTPPGWKTEHDDLTALEPGAAYRVSVVSTSRTTDAVVGFTLADLEKLKDDEVLTYKKGGGTTRQKADKFRANALKLC